ncbi:MAG: META domain-containing protein [Chitinophagaceae bacterium]|nr:META domain-containing protein [Chitinophagaceae bacterium]
MKRYTFISAAALLLFSGFVMKKQAVPFYDTKWLLKKIYTQSGTEEVNTKAFIRFNAVKNSAGGNGSCNSFGGTLLAAKDSISITNIFSTKMYCDGVQQTEDSFFGQLEKINRFKIKDKTLLLYDDSNLLLEFTSE